MTIRFAGARARGKSVLRAWRCRSVPLCAANDNTRNLAGDATLVAALRHFARHGIASGQRAGLNARTAMLAGDKAEADRWLAICDRLDRRLAARIKQAAAANTPF